MFEDVLRFWLDRGVDGFRVDVAHGLIKEDGLPDQVLTRGREGRPRASMVEQEIEDEPMWDQPGVHEVYRHWHQVLADYAGDRMAVAESWARTPEAVARYVRSDELHQAFNFDFLFSPGRRRPSAKVIEQTLTALGEVAGEPTWVLSNHDVHRHVTRYGGGAQGLARARPRRLVSLALPGSAYLYQGEELGLEEVDVARRTGRTPLAAHRQPGRDGCRVPIPWSGDRPPFGFGPGDQQPWIPQPDGWSRSASPRRTGDPASTLEFYRTALATRRQWARDATLDGASIEVDGDPARRCAAARSRSQLDLRQGGPAGARR